MCVVKTFVPVSI